MAGGMVLPVAVLRDGARSRSARLLRRRSRRRREGMKPDDVIKRIERQDAIDLARALGNLDSPPVSAGGAAQFVYACLGRNGFKPRKYALTPERFNVAAWLPGHGGGYNLIFNSHLDTTLRPDAIWSARDPLDPLYHSAWVQGD